MFLLSEMAPTPTLRYYFSEAIYHTYGKNLSKYLREDDVELEDELDEELKEENPQSIKDRILNMDPSVFKGNFFKALIFFTGALKAVHALGYAIIGTYKIGINIKTIKLWLFGNRKDFMRYAKRHGKQDMLNMLNDAERMLGGIKNVRIVSAIIAMSVIFAGLKSGIIQALTKLMVNALKKGVQAITATFKYIWNFLINIFKRKKRESFIIREKEDIDQILAGLETSEVEVPKTKKGVHLKIKERFKAAMKVLMYVVTTNFIYKVFKGFSDNKVLIEKLEDRINQFKKVDPRLAAIIKQLSKSNKKWLTVFIIVFFIVLIFSSTMFLVYLRQLIKGDYKNIEYAFRKAIIEKFDKIVNKIKSVFPECSWSNR